MTEWLGLSAVELARIQFAFVVSFHIIFPAFTIGLAAWLAVLNGLHLITRDEIYIRLFDYWKIIFAVVFGMGVVSGVVMSYQFGTNWAVFSDKAGPVIGPLLGYEVLSAFFLEAGFLGVMLFGRQRVGEKLHFAATVIVAIGTLISAFWILSVNSWMQTPAGHEIGPNGQFHPVDWWAIIFSPSFPYRFVHMVLAAFLATAFAVGAVGAWHLLKRERSMSEGARRMFSMAMWMALLVAPLQILAGDLHGLNTLEHQPAKVAAMEGHYESHPNGGAPFIVLGWPDDEAETVHYALKIPYASSLILTHDLTSPLKGLKDFPKEDRPPVAPVFFAFRIMLALGFLMAAVGIWSGIARWRGRLYHDRRLLKAALLMGPSGFIALLAGWFVTEIGRQPWTVYGLLRTAESASAVDAPAVGLSLLAFITVYVVVFGAGIYFVLRLMARDPRAHIDIDEVGVLRAAGITPAMELGAAEGRHG